MTRECDYKKVINVLLCVMVWSICLAMDESVLQQNAFIVMEISQLIKIRLLWCVNVF